MVIDKFGLFFNIEDVNFEEIKWIVRNLDKICVERNKIGKEKYVFWLEGNEIKGEKIIKLVCEKNMFLEVIIKYWLYEREKWYFLLRVNDKVWFVLLILMNRWIDFDNIIFLGNWDVRDLIIKWSVFVWSICVVLVMLVDFFLCKRLLLMMLLKRFWKWV